MVLRKIRQGRGADDDTRKLASELKERQNQQDAPGLLGRAREAPSTLGEDKANLVDIAERNLKKLENTNLSQLAKAD